MQKITTSEELKNAISQLEDRQKMEGQLLKDQFRIVREYFTPFNLIRTTFKEVFTSRNLRTVSSTAAGLAAGYFTKKYMRGFSGNLLNKVIASIL